MEKKKLQITISTQIVDDLEKLSKERGLTKSVIIMLAVEEYLAKERGKQSIQQ